MAKLALGGGPRNSDNAMFALLRAALALLGTTFVLVALLYSGYLNYTDLDGPDIDVPAERFEVSESGRELHYGRSHLARDGKLWLLHLEGSPEQIGMWKWKSLSHLGTPIADAALGLVPGVTAEVIDAILGFLYGSLAHSPGDAHIRASLQQFTRDNMRRNFNPSNPNDLRVKYYSVAGRSAARVAAAECAGGLWTNSTRIDFLDPILVLPATVFALTSPSPLSPTPNDGLVSVESSRWGTFLGCYPADHLDEIGQILHLLPDAISGFNHKELYRRILEQLHRDGL